MSLVAQGATVVAGVVGSVLLARGLGPSRLGEYALITSIATFTTLLTDMGIGGTAIRFTARAVSLGDTAGQFAVLRWAFRLRMVLVVLVSLLAYAVIPTVSAHLWHAASLTSLMRLALLIGAFGAMSSIPLIYFQARRRFRASATVTIGQTCLTLASLLGIWWARAWTLPVVLGVSVAVSAVTGFSVVFLVPREAFVPRRDAARVRCEPGWLSRFLRPPRLLAPGASLDATPVGAFAAFFVLSTVIVQVTSRVDVWLMGNLLSASEIGVYSVASKFPLPLAMVMSAVTSALWPRVSALESRTQIVAMLRRTLGLSCGVAAACVVYAVVAPLAAPLLFGPRYAASSYTAQLLCLRYCIAVLACPLAPIGYGLGLVRSYWILNLVQLVLVVAINLALQPRMGVNGAALALVAQEVLADSAVAALLYRRLRQISVTT